MKIDPRSLFSVGGFSCLSLVGSRAEAGFNEVEATAAFVTVDAVTMARAEPTRPAAPAGAHPNVRYGDVLMTRKGPDGKMIGQVIPAGKDAGILIPVTGPDGFDRNIPITGPHMLSARQALMAMTVRGQNLDDGARAVLNGLRGVFDIITANPDPARFPGQIIGQAFLGKLLDQVGNLRLSISEEEFGRRARAETIRSRISTINPTHPDGVTGYASLDEILQEIGIRTEGSADGARRYGHAGPAESRVREQITALQATRGIFDQLSKTPIRKMAIRQISSGEYSLLLDELAERTLSGQWVQLTLAKTVSALQGGRMDSGKSGNGGEASILSTDGLDILAIRVAGGQAMICAWPSADRIPLTDNGSEYLLNISPEEIPDEAEIIRLKGALELIMADMAMENDQGRVGQLS